jgi:hypothetical protein
MAGPPAVTAKLGAVNSGAVNSVLLPLRQVRGDHLQGDRDADADDDRDSGADPDLPKGVLPPCWPRNAAMIPTISAASSPSRSPITKRGQHALSSVPWCS